MKCKMNSKFFYAVKIAIAETHGRTINYTIFYGSIDSNKVISLGNNELC